MADVKKTDDLDLSGLEDTQLDLSNLEGEDAPLDLSNLEGEDTPVQAPVAAPKQVKDYGPIPDTSQDNLSVVQEPAYKLSLTPEQSRTPFSMASAIGEQILENDRANFYITEAPAVGELRETSVRVPKEKVLSLFSEDVPSDDKKYLNGSADIYTVTPDGEVSAPESLPFKEFRKRALLAPAAFITKADADSAVEYLKSAIKDNGADLEGVEVKGAKYPNEKDPVSTTSGIMLYPAGSAGDYAIVSQDDLIAMLLRRQPGIYARMSRVSEDGAEETKHAENLTEVKELMDEGYSFSGKGHRKLRAYVDMVQKFKGPKKEYLEAAYGDASGTQLALSALNSVTWSLSNLLLTNMDLRIIKDPREPKVTAYEPDELLAMQAANPYADLVGSLMGAATLPSLGIKAAKNLAKGRLSNFLSPRAIYALALGGEGALANILFTGTDNVLRGEEFLNGWITAEAGLLGAVVGGVAGRFIGPRTTSALGGGVEAASSADLLVGAGSSINRRMYKVPGLKLPGEASAKEPYFFEQVRVAKRSAGDIVSVVDSARAKYPPKLERVRKEQQDLVDSYSTVLASAVDDAKLSIDRNLGMELPNTPDTLSGRILARIAKLDSKDMKELLRARNELSGVFGEIASGQVKEVIKDVAVQKKVLNLISQAKRDLDLNVVGQNSLSKHTLYDAYEEILNYANKFPKLTAAEEEARAAIPRIGSAPDPKDVDALIGSIQTDMLIINKGANMDVGVELSGFGSFLDKRIHTADEFIDFIKLNKIPVKKGVLDRLSEESTVVSDAHKTMGDSIKNIERRMLLAENESVSLAARGIKESTSIDELLTAISLAKSSIIGTPVANAGRVLAHAKDINDAVSKVVGSAVDITTGAGEKALIQLPKNKIEKVYEVLRAKDPNLADDLRMKLKETVSPIENEGREWLKGLLPERPSVFQSGAFPLNLLWRAPMGGVRLAAKVGLSGAALGAYLLDRVMATGMQKFGEKAIPVSKIFSGVKGARVGSPFGNLVAQTQRAAVQPILRRDFSTGPRSDTDEESIVRNWVDDVLKNLSSAKLPKTLSTAERAQIVNNTNALIDDIMFSASTNPPDSPEAALAMNNVLSILRGVPSANASEKEFSKWKEQAQVALDPTVCASAIYNLSITKNQMDTLAKAYPRLHETLQILAGNCVAQINAASSFPGEKYRLLDKKVKKTFEVLLGKDPYPDNPISRSPAGMSLLQQNAINVPPQPQPAPKKMGAGSKKAAVAAVAPDSLQVQNRQ